MNINIYIGFIPVYLDATNPPPGGRFSNYYATTGQAGHRHRHSHWGNTFLFNKITLYFKLRF